MDGNFNQYTEPQSYHAYDALFPNGPDQSFDDASWGLNASNGYQIPPSGQPVVSSGWQPNANNLSATSAHTNYNQQTTPYSRSLSHSPAPFGQNAFGVYGNQTNYQYSQPQYDPALISSSNYGQPSSFNHVNYSLPQQSPGTIAPQALQHETRLPQTTNQNDVQNFAQSSRSQLGVAKGPVNDYVNHSALVAAIPKGTGSGMHSVVNFDQLVRATNSERMGSYLNVGKQTHDWPVNRTTALPQYVPRRSKNDLRKLVGNDQSLLAKIGKKSIKREKDLTLIRSDVRPFKNNSTAAQSTSPIKYEHDSSSEEDSSDDDDDSSYTSDEDLEGSPLPNKRPDNPKDAVGYDTIKALWRSKRKAVDSETVKKALVDFWDVVKTIRDRWKSDSDALKAAEEKKKAGELPLLESRVKDQREMIESAFKAALKHGHRSIVELLGENLSLVFLCYQFLLDRFKRDEVNGSLSRVMLEMLSLFTTLTNDKLEKTHLVKLLPRFTKNGDAKTQFYAKRITQNAASASNKPASEVAAVKKPVPASTSPAGKVGEPERVAGVKRAASNAGDGTAAKKIATGASRLNGPIAAVKANGVVKKPSTTVEAVKTNGATSATPITKTKQVTAKPSGFFSSLQSASKKPGTSIKAGQPALGSASKPAERKVASTAAPPASKAGFSFAQTIASIGKAKEDKPAPKQETELPPETAEQKATRLRKEARRQLHVSFKDAEELVEIRYFTHDPEEEIGHDSSQVRDVGDLAGEGRMLKQHRDMMDVDEEEEVVVEERLVEFTPPKPIDFSDMDPEERKRNYAPFGGGEMNVDSSERAKREDYEAANLIVFYTSAHDIPPNPREPSDPYNGGHVESITHFGAPEQKFADRARENKAAQVQARRPAPYQGFGYPAGNQQYQLITSQAPAPPAMAAPDIQSILAKLQQSMPAQHQQFPQAPPMAPYGNVQAPHMPNMGGFAPQQFNPPAQQPDLASILAAIQPQGAPHMGGGFGAPAAGGFAPQMMQSEVETAEQRRLREQAQKNHPFFKTKVCKYWQEGRCIRGDDCTYLHETGGDAS